MCDGRTGRVSLQESISDSETDISPNSKIDFVQLFPSELSQKLFSYLPDRDLLSCSSCSSDWNRTIDENGLWKLMCGRKGWLNNGSTDPLRWTRVLSHVAENKTFKFRPSPVYSGSNNLVCDWGLYFRHCFHLEKNWQKGICVIEEMDIPEDVPANHISNVTGFNGNLLAVATSTGCVILWSLEGVPKLITTIEPEESTLTFNMAVKAIQLTPDYLTVLYANNELHVYLLHTGIHDGENYNAYDRLYKTDLKGSPTPNHSEFRLECIDQAMADCLDFTREDNRHNVNQWIQTWIQWNIRSINDRIDYSSENMLLLSLENTIVLAGWNCRNVLVFDMLGRRFIKSIDLPQSAKCCKCFLSSSKLFVSAKKVLIPGSMEHCEVSAHYIFVFSRVSNSFEESDYNEINSVSSIQEIQTDEKTGRVAYVSYHGAVMGFDLSTKDLMFLHQSNGNVDNLLVIGEYILYHQFHGCIFALNWVGEVLYDIDAHIGGIVRGLQCVNQFVISAGDAMELCVWDLKTGKIVFKKFSLF